MPYLFYFEVMRFQMAGIDFQAALHLTAGIWEQRLAHEI